MVQIIRTSLIPPLKWKNGGGVTREVIRVPPGGDSFRWRVSIAQIDAAGPFSNFAGYLRTLVLLRGSGVELCGAGAQPIQLREVGDSVVFDGALPIHCRLLGSACTDLNLMVDQSMRAPRSWIARVMERQPFDVEAGSIRLVFAVAGALDLLSEGTRVRLDEWDLAVMAPGDVVSVAPVWAAAATPSSAAAPLVFFATLDDNSA